MCYNQQQKIRINNVFSFLHDYEGVFSAYNLSNTKEHISDCHPNRQRKKIFENHFTAEHSSKFTDYNYS